MGENTVGISKIQCIFAQYLPYDNSNLFLSEKIQISFIFPYKFLDSDIKEMLIPCPS